MNGSPLKSSAMAIAAALVAGGLVYFALQANIRRLTAENERLRAQLDESNQAREAALARMESEADRKQREQDKTELLRLRGEVGRLRLQKDEVEKLRQANSELSAALAKTAQSSGVTPDPEQDPERQMAIAHLNDAKQLVLGLLLFAEDNQQSLPATLNQSSNYWGNTSRLFTNQFELVLQRPFREVTNPSAVIAVRQKEAWFSKGSWVKAYGFADGHAEIKKQPPEGFEAWEQAHIQPATPR